MSAGAKAMFSSWSANLERRGAAMVAVLVALVVIWRSRRR
jgi:hypothetical protein